MKRRLDLLKTRRSAIFAGTLLALGCVILLLLPLRLALLAQQKEILAKQQELARERAEASIHPALLQQLRELNARAATLPYFFQGKSATAVQSQIQQVVEAIITSAGASIRSTQILPARATTSLDIVDIQYDVMTGMSKLAPLVHALETHAPFLFLRDVQIAGGESWQSGSASGDHDIPLHIRWIVRAYRWRGVP